MRTIGVTTAVLAFLTLTLALNDDVIHVRLRTTRSLDSPDVDHTKATSSSYSSSVVHHDFSVPESMGGLTVQDPPKGWPFTDPSLQQRAAKHGLLGNTHVLDSTKAEGKSRVLSNQHKQYHVASHQAPEQGHAASNLNKQYHVASNQASGHRQAASNQHKQYHTASNPAPNLHKQYHVASSHVHDNDQHQQTASSQINHYQVAANEDIKNSHIVSNQHHQVASNKINPYQVASSQDPIQKRTRPNGRQRALEMHNSEGGYQQRPDDEDFSPVSFVHSELQKNLGVRAGKGMTHVSQGSEHLQPGFLGPRQTRLGDAHTPAAHQQVDSSPNFQLFHGGQFAGPQQTSFGAEDVVNPMEIRFEDDKPKPPRKLKKKKTPKPQGQEPAAINVGYTIGFVNSPETQLKESTPSPTFHHHDHSGLITAGSNNGVLTLANDEIIVGKPAAKWKARETGASGQAASTQSHQIIHMIHTPQTEQQGVGNDVPTVHHILHNRPLNPQQLSDIFANNYESNKVYTHVLPTQQQEDVDYQIQTVPDQQIHGHQHENDHVMLVTQQSPTSETIYYSPQQYQWKNVNGVEVASSIPVTEEQRDDLPNPHHKPQPTPRPQQQQQQQQQQQEQQQQQPQAQALHQAPPTVSSVNEEQYVYVPVLEDAPSQQHYHQTIPTLSHHGQSVTYSQALPLIGGPGGSSSNFDHKKALTHSVGFDYSNAMVTYPHLQSGRTIPSSHQQQEGVRVSSGDGGGGGNYGLKDGFVIVENEGKKTPTRLNHEELNGDMDIKVEYVDVDANSVMGFTAPGQQHGITYELPKKTLGLPADFPKGFNFGPMPAVAGGQQNIGQHLLLNQHGGSQQQNFEQGPHQPNFAQGPHQSNFAQGPHQPNFPQSHQLNFVQGSHQPNFAQGSHQPTFEQVFGNVNGGELGHTFGQTEHDQKFTFGHPLPMFPALNFPGGHRGKEIFKHPNILHLQNGGNNGGHQGFGGHLSSNSIFGPPGGPPGHTRFPGPHSGPQPGRVIMSQGTFSGEGLPIAGLVQAGVPPFGDLKETLMMQSGRPGGHMGNGGFRGGRVIPPPRFIQNFYQGKGQYGQGGRPPNQGLFFQQFMINPQQQGNPQGRPIQFPQQQQSQLQPPPPMNEPIVLSMNTLGHHHAVQNAIRNANQEKQALRQQNHNMQLHGQSSNSRPSFPHNMHQHILFHRERQPLKPRENQHVVLHIENDKKEKKMQKQRNELAKFNSMLSVALLKPVGKVTSQYVIKNDVKSADFPITSSFTLDLKPPKMEK